MDIREYLRGHAVDFQPLLHGPMPSATRTAHSLHVSGGRVAKTVLVRCEKGFALAVVAATHRVDLTRMATILGVVDVRLATEEEAMAVFHDCERGALPPFGRLYGLETIVDLGLAKVGPIVVEGNVRHEGLRLEFHDYDAVESPVKAEIAAPPGPSRRAG
jgi:Ala-tRNA(Pro) deacylase